MCGRSGISQPSVRGFARRMCTAPCHDTLLPCRVGIGIGIGRWQARRH
jgi:hypothetical protein